MITVTKTSAPNVGRGDRLRDGSMLLVLILDEVNGAERIVAWG
jgi:hypothetical protein